jgi:hypothetical protein
VRVRVRVRVRERAPYLELVVVVHDELAGGQQAPKQG